MKERPILFSAPMVRAILDGRKTQTRRVVKLPVEYCSRWAGGWHIIGKAASIAVQTFNALRGKPLGVDPTVCPYGQPGDRLWVRETWRHTAGSLEEARAITEDITGGTAVDWRATYIDRCMNEMGFSLEDAEVADSFETWRPSIHMPRWASRILLEIVSVRVERLNDISASDAKQEGLKRIEYKGESFGFDGGNPTGYGSATGAFRALWEQINGSGSWDANPWVWVIEFKRVTP